MPAMNPSKDAMSVVMVQFSPEAATTKETVDRNIKKIEEYVVRATNGFPGVDLIVFLNTALMVLDLTRMQLT